MEAERERFEEWFFGEQGKPYDGAQAFAWSAWQARAQLPASPPSVSVGEELREAIIKVIEDEDIPTENYCMNVFDDGPQFRRNIIAAIRAIKIPTSNPAQPPCTDERPCIPCFTDNGACTDPAKSAEHARAVVEKVQLTEEQVVKCIVDAGCLGTVKMSFDSGPYEITRPSMNATKFVREIERAHGITEPKS